MVSFQRSRFVNTVSVFGLEQQIWAAGLWLPWTDELICLLYCGSMHELTLQTCQRLWMIQRCNHLSWLYSQSALLCLQLNRRRGKTLVTPDVSYAAVFVSHFVFSNSLHTQSWSCAFERQMSFRHMHLLIHFKEPTVALNMIWSWASAMFWGSWSWDHSQVCGSIHKQKTTLLKHIFSLLNLFLSFSPPLLKPFPPLDLKLGRFSQESHE